MQKNLENLRNGWGGLEPPFSLLLVHLSRRANAAPPIRSRPLGKGLLETGAGMGQQGALHAGTGTVFHAALVPTLESYHPQSSVRNSAKRGIHHCSGR